MAKPVTLGRIQDKETKELAAEIHLGLYSLTKVYKPTQEFENCFQTGMFVKSNPTAFPHVMHFLLYHLDPAEFSVRFLWPLHFDKTAEKEFRQSCVKYINDLNKKHKLEMEEVGNYIVVVPGGMKFMKVLLEVIKLLQIETLRLHNRTDLLDLPKESIFDTKFRSGVKREYDTLLRVNKDFVQATKRETKLFQKKNEMLKYYIRVLEGKIKETPHNPQLEEEIAQEVDSICLKMNQVIKLVADLEKTCGSGPGQHNNPFERINLSNSIVKIVEHHKWVMTNDKYTHKINCSAILDIAARILGELAHSPISVRPIQPLEVVNQNHEMALFLRSIAVIEAELEQVKCNIMADQQRHKEHEEAHPKMPIIFPERDYPLVEVEEVDLGAFYHDLKRCVDLPTDDHIPRLALEDVLPEPVVFSPPAGRSLNGTITNHSFSNSFAMTARKNPNMTARKRTKAISVLKTISRSTKRPKINMDALSKLAKSGFTESLFNASTTTWKQKSLSIAKAETSTEFIKPPAMRLSGIFSDSIVPKFMPNSTSIFNSTTNEQALKLQSSVILTDITNKEVTESLKEDPIDSVLTKQFQEIAINKDQENIFDCSDTILME